MENSSSVATWLCTHEFLFGMVPTIEEVIQSIDAVTEDDIFDFYLENDGTIKLSVNNAANLVTNTIYNCNGKQPLAIVVTYKKSLINNNIKLYVNGKLEDTSDYTATFSGATAHNTVSIGFTL